jgi:hypothetical protein
VRVAAEVETGAETGIAAEVVRQGREPVAETGMAAVAERAAEAVCQGREAAVGGAG